MGDAGRHRSEAGYLSVSLLWEAPRSDVGARVDRARGRWSKRRHAHMECVRNARAAGDLPTRESGSKSERGPRPSFGARMRGFSGIRGRTDETDPHPLLHRPRRLRPRRRLSTAAGAAANPVMGAKAFAAPYGKGFGTAEPSEIFNGGDPSGSVTHIKWSGWGNPTAIGYGLNPIFKPHGGYYSKPAQIELRATNLGKCGNQAAYTRLEVSASPSTPAASSASGSPGPARRRSASRPTEGAVKLPPRAADRRPRPAKAADQPPGRGGFEEDGLTGRSRALPAFGFRGVGGPVRLGPAPPGRVRAFPYKDGKVRTRGHGIVTSGTKAPRRRAEASPLPPTVTYPRVRALFVTLLSAQIHPTKIGPPRGGPGIS